MLIFRFQKRKQDKSQMAPRSIKCCLKTTECFQKTTIVTVASWIE